MPRPNPGPHLTRVAGKPNWYIGWTDRGLPRRRSTGTENEAEAQRALADWLADLARPPDTVVLGTLLDAYLKDRAEHVVDLARLEYAVKPLKAKLGSLNPSQLERPIVRDYGAWRKRAGKKPGTILKELRTLRAALLWGVANKWIPHAPPIDMPPAPPPRDRWLTRDEVDKLLATTHGHLKLFILIGLHTAARTQAILGLTWDRVDLERGLIHFAEPGRRETTKRRVAVPINAELMAALQDAREAAQTEVVIEWGDRPVKRVVQGFKRAALRAGLKGGVTPHTLRHTAATWMAQAGVPMWEIAGVLGHSDVTTTSRIYAKHSPDHLRRAVAALGRSDH